MNTKAILAALCLTSLGTAFAGEAAPAPAGLSRAEVRADLHLWMRSGMDRYVNSEAMMEVNEPGYQAALARYISARNSPAYAEEVRRIEEQRQPQARVAQGD